MILSVTPNPCVDKTIFVPEVALGTFMRAPRYTTIAGGKGCNVARAVRVLGGEATPLVIVGGPPGQHVVDMLAQQDGLPVVPVWVAAHTRTITTVLEEQHHRQTAFFEPGPSVTPEEAAAVLAAFEAALAGAACVTLNGTVPDSSLVDLYPQLIRAARGAGVPVLLDSHGAEYAAGLEAGPDWTKPNVAELEKLLGRALPDEAACWAAIDEVRTRYGVCTVLLSRGAAPMLVATAQQRFIVHPPSIEEVNPVGSGDAFVAGFVWSMERGAPLEDALRLGAACGAANACSWDIGHFTRAEVEGLLPQVRVERG